jgi:hypothetical protein
VTGTHTITPTRTNTPLESGPVITYFGIAAADGCAACPGVPNCNCGASPTPTPEFDGQGRQVFTVSFGSGFLLVIEARPGGSGLTVGTSVPVPGSPTRPDMQAQSTEDLGNGSATVCDAQPASEGGGGIPGFNPPNFGPGQDITNALQDFACRLTPFQPTSPCTLNRFGAFAVLTPGGLPGTARQFCHILFCHILRTIEEFPVADTILTAQSTDTGGFIGPQKQIVVRRLP